MFSSNDPNELYRQIKQGPYNRGLKERIQWLWLGERLFGDQLFEAWYDRTKATRAVIGLLCHICGFIVVTVAGRVNPVITVPTGAFLTALTMYIIVNGLLFITELGKPPRNLLSRIVMWLGAGAFWTLSITSLTILFSHREALGIIIPLALYRIWRGIKFARDASWVLRR